jgi:hypothetical protein
MSSERIQPIKPKEVADYKRENFPNEVFEAFNELIVENAGPGEIVVKQKDVVKRMVDKGLNRDEIYKKGWLDIEDVYRKAGWKVGYDKPGYNESYDAFFVFKQRKPGE